MRKFKAIFVNPDGLRITIHFLWPNWFKIAVKAKWEMRSRKEHSGYGPWTLRGIDVA